MKTYAGSCSMLPHSLPQTTMFCFSSLYPFILFVLILKRLTLFEYIWSPTKCDTAQMKLIQGTKCGKENTRDKMVGVLFPQIWLDTNLGFSSPMLLLLLRCCCCCSLAKLCPTLCKPMNCSRPGFSVLQRLPEFVQTHVHWVSDAISSPVTPFSSCPQSFPASGIFPVSQLFVSRGQSTGASVSASVLPMNIQDWFPWGLTGLMSLLSK